MQNERLKYIQKDESGLNEKDSGSYQEWLYLNHTELYEPIYTEGFGTTQSMRHSFVKKKVRGESWTVSILLIVLVIIAFLNVTKRKRLKQFVESFYSNRFVDQLIREEGLLGSVVNLYLLITSVLVISLFSYQFIRIYLNEKGLDELFDFKFFWICFFGVSGMFLLKLILYSLSSLVLDLREKFSEYIFQYFLFFQATGFFLFPVVLGIEFVEYFSSYFIANLGVMVLAVIFVLRQFKVIYIGIVSTSFSPLYIILYLCTLEILPLLVISKFIMNNITP